MFKYIVLLKFSFICLFTSGNSHAESTNNYHDLEYFLVAFGAMFGDNPVNRTYNFDYGLSFLGFSQSQVLLEEKNDRGAVQATYVLHLQGYYFWVPFTDIIYSYQKIDSANQSESIFGTRGREIEKSTGELQKITYIAFHDYPSGKQGPSMGFSLGKFNSSFEVKDTLRSKRIDVDRIVLGVKITFYF